MKLWRSLIASRRVKEQHRFGCILAKIMLDFSHFSLWVSTFWPHECDCWHANMHSLHKTKYTNQKSRHYKALCKLCHTYTHQSSEEQAHNQQAMQIVYFELDSPGTQRSLTSETGPITQDIFYIYNYMTFSSLPAITAAPLREPKEKVLLDLF